MKGILLRGIMEVVFYALTLPLRLIVIIGSICFYIPYVSIRYECSFMEGLKVFASGMKASFLNEITWVKTGNCKDLCEVVTDLTSEEES